MFLKLISIILQAYVTVDGVPLDILIDGLPAQNRAVFFCLASILSESFDFLTDSGAVKGLLLAASLLFSYWSKGTCILMWSKVSLVVFFVGSRLT